MMDKLINLGVKLSGLGWIWAKLDGYKTYLGAAGLILTGAAGVLNGFIGVEQQHNAAALLHWVKGLPNDAAWLMLMNGFGILGLGHKVQKAGNGQTTLTPQVTK